MHFISHKRWNMMIHSYMMRPPSTKQKQTLALTQRPQKWTSVAQATVRTQSLRHQWGKSTWLRESRGGFWFLFYFFWEQHPFTALRSFPPASDLPFCSIPKSWGSCITDSFPEEGCYMDYPLGNLSRNLSWQVSIGTGQLNKFLG